MLEVSSTWLGSQFGLGRKSDIDSQSGLRS